jgi:hydrogenase maturation protein HypF
MPSATRLKLTVRGAVQGVGFRPFVFRLATELALSGWVNNSAQGVMIEVEGAPATLERFLSRLERERPPHSFIQSLEPSWLDSVGYTGFEIRASETTGAPTALVLPDLATCPDCQGEIFDPGNRRYFYPFTNCTNCGPRFSIIESLPYDRPNTSMKRFEMCPQCQAEYRDPHNRRFHAQPNACPQCGPHLELWDQQGKSLLETAGDQAVLRAAAKAISDGQILAVKGLGGFHLMVAAENEAAVHRLRVLKHREEKPLALMCRSIQVVRALCEVSPLEERLLRSPECPIVLSQRHAPGLELTAAAAGATLPGRALAPSVAPGNPNLGVMLPYTPLHHLLLYLIGGPVVATSGNLSDEPICIEEREALERLGEIADLFLVHNRPIVRHVDDSVARVIAGRELILRRARGYAPLPLSLETPAIEQGSVLAVGAHLKNSIALAIGPQVFVSQHIGDLETDQALRAFRRAIADFQQLYQTAPSIVAADAHPDYLSTQFARELCREQTQRASQSHDGPPRLVSVQHHLAHVLSCMAENQLHPPLLGVAWDGTGFGLDGTIWGGEFFLIRKGDWERVAHLRPFRLPGGEQAIKEPRRTALGLLHAGMGDEGLNQTGLPTLQAFSPQELPLLRRMLERQINSPPTSSVGRLFDAVASLAGARQKVHFEGQAAMELEFALAGAAEEGAYALTLTPQEKVMVLDWLPLLKELLHDLQKGTALAVVSSRFHNSLVEAIVNVARHFGQERVLLSGGCFQNRYLTERAVHRLQAEGFRPYWHQRVPPNDGGIALGQVVAVNGW